MTRDDIKEEFGVTCPHWEPCDCLVDGADFMADEILKLRTAIDRVRALHRSYLAEAPAGGRVSYCSCSMPHRHPCPTLRALDGDA
jgi:hypothetical protein